MNYIGRVFLHFCQGLRPYVDRTVQCTYLLLSLHLTLALLISTLELYNVRTLELTLERTLELRSYVTFTVTYTYRLVLAIDCIKHKYLINDS